MNKPNIVLFISDQHNPKVIGSNGNEVIKTPNLDKIYNNSMVFSNAYCGSPLCVPSRTSLLTGQYPMKNGVFINRQSLHTGRATIAHAINNAGYQTVLSGRMHFTGAEQHYGFEKRLVGDVTPIYHGFNYIEESFGELYRAFIPTEDGYIKCGSGDSSNYHFDQDVVDATREFLNNRKDKRPLFLTIGLSSPHPPYVCHEEAFDYYRRELPDTTQEFNTNINYHPAIQSFIDQRKLDKLTQEQILDIQAAYYGLVENLDDNIGKLHDAISTTLGMENTIFIYTSDHGDHIGSKNLIWKGTFFEDSVKVPLMISAGEQFSTGQIVDTPVSLVDLSRTLLDIADADPLPNMSGNSLLGVLEGKNELDENRAIISQIGNYPMSHIPSAMIRKGQWKLIAYHQYPMPSLYNLIEDPNEEHDLAEDPNHSAIVEKLITELSKHWNPSEVSKTCLSASKHYKILSKWSHQTKFEKKENWHPSDNKLNFVTK